MRLLEILRRLHVAQKDQRLERLHVGAGRDHVDGDGYARIIVVAELADQPPSDLDRTVIAPNQIRTVIETYRESLLTELFPGRREVPKTLVFAKDDNHAEEIVGIVRDVFGKGNDLSILNLVVCKFLRRQLASRS